MKLPVLEEMGDIAPAIENLMRLQAEYARGEPGVSRAMRDVAHKAVAAEIERYIIQRVFDTAHCLEGPATAAGNGLTTMVRQVTPILIAIVIGYVLAQPTLLAIWPS